jgi:hypothetical protein
MKDGSVRLNASVGSTHESWPQGVYVKAQAAVAFPKSVTHIRLCDHDPAGHEHDIGIERRGLGS